MAELTHLSGGGTGDPGESTVTAAVIQALRGQLSQRDADAAALRAALEDSRAAEARWREREARAVAESWQQRVEAEDARAAHAAADADWRHELERREQAWQAARDADAAALGARLAEAQAEAARLRAELDKVREQFAQFRAAHAPGLAAIRGIGPKLEADLRAAGIESYAELARRTPTELQLLLNPPKWRKLDFKSWIAQAAVLAKNEAE